MQRRQFYGNDRGIHDSSSGFTRWPDDISTGRQRAEAITSCPMENGLYYVGEWHFHPGGSPEPSGDDFRSMTSIAANPDYQCLEPVMIILGGDPAGSYSLSASVFPRGDAPIRLREVLI
ncbi:TPA: Mov34/MPN/PAD-1 family protein [Klebsiella variicola subsp. variicola]|nr:Mov34/MPN/PAD-1 family protein [Klebsiella variicola subsp. variicola]